MQNDVVDDGRIVKCRRGTSFCTNYIGEKLAPLLFITNNLDSE